MKLLCGIVLAGTLIFVSLANADYTANFPPVSDELSSTEENSARKVDVAFKPITEKMFPMVGGRFRQRRLAVNGNVGGNGTNTTEDRIVHFLHITKVGGTTMCNQALRNLGSRRVRANTNCNVQSDWRCCGKKDTVEAQIKFARKTKLKYVATERPMYESMDPVHYRYVVAMRDSKARYVSHYLWLKRNRKDLTFKDFLERQKDNYIARWICGSRCSSRGKFSLTKEDWAYTVKRLRKFEDIIFVDNGIFEESFNRFSRAVGWKDYNGHTSKARSSWGGKKAEKEFQQHVESFQWDPRMTLLDDALYQYAKSLYSKEKNVSAAIDWSKMENQTPSGVFKKTEISEKPSYPRLVWFNVVEGER